MSKSATFTKTNKYFPANLREGHHRKAVLIEKIRRVDQALLAEQTARLIFEALSAEEKEKLGDKLQKLNYIGQAADKAGIQQLKSAIDAARKDVMKHKAGGLGAMLKRGLGKLGAKGANPVFKCIGLLSALESGFDGLLDELKDAGVDLENEASPIEQLGSDADDLEKVVVKSFQPEGVFAKMKSLFGSSGGIPYMGDVKDFVADLLLLSPKNIKTLRSIVMKDGKISDVVDSSGITSTTRSESPSLRPAQNMSQVVAAAAAKKPDGEGGSPAQSSAAAAEDPKKATKAFVDHVADQSGVEPEVVNKVLAALLKAKKLRGLEENASPLNNDRSLLTLKDVKDARSLYLESWGSSRRWIDLLSEVKISDDMMKKIDSAKAILPGEDKYKEQNVKELEKFISKLQADEPIDEGDFNFLKNIFGNVKNEKFDKDKFLSELEELVKKSKEKIASSKSMQAKRTKAVDSIKDSLSDVKPDDIVKVLQAIPDYLISETRGLKSISKYR